jgi:beta-lactamase regulating signal transducer with metallopeptidase domain
MSKEGVGMEFAIAEIRVKLNMILSQLVLMNRDSSINGVRDSMQTGFTSLAFAIAIIAMAFNVVATTFSSALSRVWVFALVGVGIGFLVAANMRQRRISKEFEAIKEHETQVEEMLEELQEQSKKLFGKLED